MSAPLPTPGEMTAQQWLALAQVQDRSADDNAEWARRMAQSDGEFATVLQDGAGINRALAAACRAMAFGCTELDVDQLFVRAPGDRKSRCRFEVKARHWTTGQPRRRGSGLTLTAALLDAAGEGVE